MRPTATSPPGDQPVDRSVLLKRSHQQRSYNSNRDLSDTRKKNSQTINHLPPFDNGSDPLSPGNNSLSSSSGRHVGIGGIGDLEYDPDELDRLLAAENESLQQDDMVFLARQVPPLGRQILQFETLDSLNGPDNNMDELLQEGLELFQSDGDLSSVAQPFDEHDAFFESEAVGHSNNTSAAEMTFPTTTSEAILSQWRERSSDADNESLSRSRSRSREASNEYFADSTNSLSSMSAAGKMNHLDLNPTSLAQLQYPFPTQYAHPANEAHSRSGSSWTSSDSSAKNSAGANSGPPSPTSGRSSIADALLPKESTSAVTATSSIVGNADNAVFGVTPAATSDTSFFGPPASSSSSVKYADQGSSEKDKRGNYRCGRCGQPKVNHVCAYVDMITSSSTTQTDTNHIVNVIEGRIVEPFPGERFVTVGKKKKILLPGAATGLMSAQLYCSEANKPAVVNTAVKSFASFSPHDSNPLINNSTSTEVSEEKEEDGSSPDRKEIMSTKNRSESATLCSPFVAFGI